MERSYSHRSREDLLALRERLSSMNNTGRASVIVCAMYSGVMKAPFLARMSLRMLQARFGQSDGLVRFVTLIASHPKQIEPLWEGLMGWMLEGKDAYDPLSAGGWNKKELDAVIGFARGVGMPPDPDAPTPDAPTPEKDERELNVPSM